MRGHLTHSPTLFTATGLPCFILFLTVVLFIDWFSCRCLNQIPMQV